MATETWQGKVQGFIRMEAGFEVIMCSFKQNLDLVHIVMAGPIAPDGREPGSNDPSFDHWSWNWVKSIATRYDGIGGERVRLDYDHFVTSFGYDLDLFRRDDNLPRLENLSVASLDKIRADVDAMVRDWNPSLELYKDDSINWQSIADMVVERYANELRYLTSGKLTTSEQFFDELGQFLCVYIDSDIRNTTAEIDRCTEQFVPGELGLPKSVSGRAVYSIAKNICSTLLTAYDMRILVQDSVESLKLLIKYLDWTIWRRCPECPLDKICFIPVWPFGAPEDREHPQCRNAAEIEGRMGYWGYFGSPRLEADMHGRG